MAGSTGTGRNENYIPMPRVYADIRRHLKISHGVSKETWAPARHAILHESACDHTHRREA